MTKSNPIGASDNNFINIGRKIVALHFYWFCVTVLHLLQNRTGQFSLIFLVFIEILLFLIHFEPLREPLISFPTVFILYLQVYNIDMTFQNNSDYN